MRTLIPEVFWFSLRLQFFVHLNELKQTQSSVNSWRCKRMLGRHNHPAAGDDAAVDECIKACILFLTLANKAYSIYWDLLVTSIAHLCCDSSMKPSRMIRFGLY